MVSVITTIYNGEDFIVRCLQQVLNQSLGIQNIEHVFIDDCSTDHTSKILREIENNYNHVKVVLSPKKIGRGIALALGVQSSKFDIISILDVDDLWHIDKLKVQLQHKHLIVEGNGLFTKTFRVENQLVGKFKSQLRQVIEKNNFEIIEKNYFQLLMKSNLSHSSFIFSKKYYTYEENFSQSQYDLNIYFKIFLNKKKLFLVREALTLNTIHPKQNFQFNNSIRYNTNSILHRLNFIKKKGLYWLIPLLIIKYFYQISRHFFSKK